MSMTLHPVPSPLEPEGEGLAPPEGMVEGVDREAVLLAQNGWLFRPPESHITDPDRSPPVPFGLPELDSAFTGGLRTGLHTFAGFQHNGKTLLLLRMLWENRDKLCVLFTADETVEEVINKLVAMATGISLDDLLYMEARRKRAIFTEHYPVLAIDDGHLNQYEMLDYIDQAEQFYGEEMRFASYDFIGYLAGSRGDDTGGSIIRAFNKAKRLVHDTQIPWVFIHQANRSGAKGGLGGATALAYAGEQQSNSIVYMRRQVNDPKHDRAQENHQPTIHISVHKNKQTYKYLRGVQGAEVQYAIDRDTGLIRPMGVGDRIMRGVSELRGMS